MDVVITKQETVLAFKKQIQIAAVRRLPLETQNQNEKLLQH
jgi:hypothetical protein